MGTDIEDMWAQVTAIAGMRSRSCSMETGLAGAMWISAGMGSASAAKPGLSSVVADVLAARCAGNGVLVQLNRLMEGRLGQLYMCMTSAG